MKKSGYVYQQSRRSSHVVDELLHKQTYPIYESCLLLDVIGHVIFKF